MFEDGGTAYIYIAYGIHAMLNAVTGENGDPSAVMIRAVEPLDGVDEMKRERGIDRENELCSGPGKLTEAFRIDTDHERQDLTSGDLRIEEWDSPPDSTINRSGRIGISAGKEMDLRFYIQDSEHVSG